MTLPALDDYLSNLAPLLPGPHSRRQRAMVEIQDHLLSEYEDRISAGQDRSVAESAALSCVGDVRTVAAGFLDLRARRAVELAEYLTAGCVVAFGAAIVTVPRSAGVIGWFAAQIACVAMVVAWLRGRRLRTLQRASAGELALSLRAMTLAIGSVVVTVTLDLRSHSGTALPVTGCAAVLAALSIVAAARLLRQIRTLGVDDGRRGASALEVLCWIGAAAVDCAGDWRVVTYPGRILPWALTHRAGASVVLAAGAGGSLSLASLREHGLSGGVHQALLSLAAAATQFAIEGGAVIVAVYSFDRILRLWPAEQATAK